MYRSSPSPYRFKSPFKSKQKHDDGFNKTRVDSRRQKVDRVIPDPFKTPQRKKSSSTVSSKKKGFWSRRLGSTKQGQGGQSPFLPPSTNQRISKSENPMRNSRKLASPFVWKSPYKRLSQTKENMDPQNKNHELRAKQKDDPMNTEVQELGHMSSSSRDDDLHTASTFSTATVTHASSTSYSIDDGSTIVTEGTHDPIAISRSYGNTLAEKVELQSPYMHHSFKAGKHEFTVDVKYSFIRTIGSGAYGVVISAHDTSNVTKVAIKMIPRAFNDEVDAKRILREIKILKHFRHENIIGIVDMMPPNVKHVEDFHDVYIVTDLMETDLHRIIYSKQSLSIDHVQYFLYQILRAVKYIHSAGVLHRDLKPSNLLVNSNCDLKVCDFGLSRGFSLTPDEFGAEITDKSLVLTEYVVTRWYRAPEIMLACHQYSKPVDVWSIGCIFAELLGRKPYFPGDDYIDQLTIICEKLGKLSDDELNFVTSEKAKRFMRKLPEKPRILLNQQFPGTPSNAIDLLSKMLTIHPAKRITIDEALSHPFLSSLHSPEDEPVCESNFDFSFENEKLHRVRLQELIWQEVGDFRQSSLPVPRRKGGK